jgi:uncharacterized protein with von Willebrand factor type A (vWA) domain
MVTQTQEKTKKGIEPEKRREEPARAAKKELTGKEAIMAVLARAADESEFLARLAKDPAEALGEYYTLTKEELAALASGDIRKIERWCGKLDKRHATWLWCRLSQEKW